MKTEHEILVAARELISDPARWTQGEAARAANGFATISICSDAVCWCAIGAVNKSAFDLSTLGMNAQCCLEEVAEQIFGLEVARINDDLGHAVILEVFDHAIAKAAASDGDAA